jgi:hypothetical protein
MLFTGFAPFGGGSLKGWGRAKRGGLLAFQLRRFASEIPLCGYRRQTLASLSLQKGRKPLTSKSKALCPLLFTGFFPF